MMKLMEQVSGVGELIVDGRSRGQTTYQLQRYQGMTGAGMPIPGLFRIEGSIEPLDLGVEQHSKVGLRLEDGRMFAISLPDKSGRVLSEGHGPSKCLCC